MKTKSRDIYTNQSRLAVRDSSHVALHGHTAGAFYVLFNLFSRVPIILKYATSESFQFLTHSPFINSLTSSSSLHNTVTESEEPNGPTNRRSFLAYVP